ncbi:hypothetical protein ACJBTP_08200, partial [Streptococcus suis]|nr:hypothetical protein [Streptococcus suis]
IVIPPAIFFYYSTLFDSRFKTLQQNPMIQQDLAISSQDYFGDLVHLALQKDLLDQKSHFLQHYVATVMDGIPQERDQRALVLD